MSQQRCVCGHVYSIHRLNRQIGDRNECWALSGDPSGPLHCGCRQFEAARQPDEPTAPAAGLAW